MFKHLLPVDTAVDEHCTDVVDTLIGPDTSFEQDCNSIAIEVIATIIVFFIVCLFFDC